MTIGHMLWVNLYFQSCHSKTITNLINLLFMAIINLNLSAIVFTVL